jgi:orotidine-5'-phosphate decarboxylase
VNSADIKLRNPLILGLDVDSAEEALKLAHALEGKLGAIKLGPRLNMRYGRELVEKIAKLAPVFVDNKYLDIPNTMEAAIRATFEAGATFATVHAWSGREALERLAQVERELNQQRPFKILVVTILTSFNESTLPPGLEKAPLAQHVTALAELVLTCGLTGLVCSPHEVAALRARSKNAFLVTPGVRLSTDASADQKRVETPEAAIRQGASALVVGRPIVEAKNPVEAAEQILASIHRGQI